MPPPCGHNLPAVGCRLCELAATRADYRKLWGIGEGQAAPPKVRTSAPPARGRCLHLGKRAEERRGCNGRMCRHLCEAGEPVAVPGGVCQTCPKWEAEYDPAARLAAPDLCGPGVIPYGGPVRVAVKPAATALPRWRPVPPPEVRPTCPRLVVTVVAGDIAEELHAATGPGQRAYAERVGADYSVIRGCTQDERMACAEKWRVRDYVPHYPGGTLYLDADVCVHPRAPDVFEVVPPGSIGMREITSQPRLMDWAWLKYREVCQSQRVLAHPTAMKRYWNSGVWVGRPEHAGYWTPPDRPYPAEHCTEEHWCRHTLATSGWPVFDLGEPWNWLWYQDRKCERVGGCWFLHLAGMSQQVGEWVQDNRTWRLAMLRLLAAVTGPAVITGGRS